MKLFSGWRCVSQMDSKGAKMIAVDADLAKEAGKK
jgi:hypothetical protein